MQRSLRGPGRARLQGGAVLPGDVRVVDGAGRRDPGHDDRDADGERDVPLVPRACPGPSIRASRSTPAPAAPTAAARSSRTAGAATAPRARRATAPPCRPAPSAASSRARSSTAPTPATRAPTARRCAAGVRAGRRAGERHDAAEGGARQRLLLHSAAAPVADERDCLSSARLPHPTTTASNHFAGCEPQDFTTHCTQTADCDAGSAATPPVCASRRAAPARQRGGVQRRSALRADLLARLLALRQRRRRRRAGQLACGGAGRRHQRRARPRTRRRRRAAAPASRRSPAATRPRAAATPGKSVMVRDPTLLDDPFWALAARARPRHRRRPSVVADGWLGADRQRDHRRRADRRRAARRRRNTSPRCRTAPTGSSTPTSSAFRPTSLSNRSISPTAPSCGEARITYALAGGVDRSPPSHDRDRRAAPAVRRRQLPHDRAGAGSRSPSSTAPRCRRRCRRSTRRF